MPEPTEWDFAVKRILKHIRRDFAEATPELVASLKDAVDVMRIQVNIWLRIDRSVVIGGEQFFHQDHAFDGHLTEAYSTRVIDENERDQLLNACRERIISIVDLVAIRTRTAAKK